LALSLSNNALVLISEVALHRAGVVPRWVTALGRVNHLGVEPAIQVYSARRLFVGRCS